MVSLALLSGVDLETQDFGFLRRKGESSLINTEEPCRAVGNREGEVSKKSAIISHNHINFTISAHTLEILHFDAFNEGIPYVDSKMKQFPINL